MNRPWMPLYIPDYLGDTGHLSTLEHGTYMLLIMHYWMNGGLPDNDLQLARVARVTIKEWKEMRETIAALFLPGWRHKRIEAELKEAEARYERRAKAGRESGKARSKDKQCSNNAQTMLEQETNNEVATRGTRQLQPHISKEMDDALNGRERLDAIEQDLRSAADLVDSPNPSLADLSPILGLLDQGMNLEEDILPVIRSRRRPNIRSWAFFTQAILDARATRQATANARGQPSARASPARLDRPSSGAASARAGITAFMNQQSNDP